MKGRIYFIIWIQLFICTAAVYSQKDPSELVYPPLEFSVPGVDRVVLDNGMIVYSKEDHELPLFSAYAMLRCGEIWVSADKAGLAGLTGTVLRTGGTKSKTGDEIDEELEFMAGSIETSIGEESATASLSVMKKDIEKGLQLFAEVLMLPRFSEDKIELARNQALESYRRRNDEPGGILSREFDKALFGKDSPYGREVTDKSIQAVTREDMIAFHKSYFYPNNMILGVAGDFNKNEMLKLIEKTFKDWKKKPLNLPPVPKVTPAPPSQVFLIGKDINQSNIAMGHYGILRHNPDYFAVQIMNEILSFQRLFFQIRTEKGWAYQVGSSFAPESNYGVFKAQMKTKVASTHEAMELMKRILSAIREKPVTDKELKTAKDTYLNSFVFRFTSASQVVNQQVMLEFHGYPREYLARFTKNIHAVTADDVLRVARKYIKPDELLMVVVGNPKGFDAPLDSFGKVTEISLGE